MTAPNARFWVYANGPAKITLKPGQTLRHSRGGPTDEGYSYEEDSWEHLGNRIEHNWFVDGRDCDGRMTKTGSRISMLEDLKAHAGLDDLSYPVWRIEDYYQRDFEAEKAGY